MTVQLLERKRHTNQFEHEMYRRATSHKMCIDPKTQTKQFLSIRYDFFPIALSCAGSIGTKRIFIVCDENFIVQVTALLVLIAQVRSPSSSMYHVIRSDTIRYVTKAAHRIKATRQKLIVILVLVLISAPFKNRSLSLSCYFL